MTGMTARRVLEIRTNNRVIIAFRTANARENTRPITAPVAFTTNPEDDDDWLYLSSDEVEALHQFTYEILAGPKTDPRLDVVDADIMCGFSWDTGIGRQECCLIDGHSIVSAHGIDHVSRSGVGHLMAPF